MEMTFYVHSSGLAKCLLLIIVKGKQPTMRIRNTVLPHDRLLECMTALLRSTIYIQNWPLSAQVDEENPVGFHFTTKQARLQIPGFLGFRSRSVGP